MFCCSLADVFDERAAPAWRADLFELVRETENLDWLLLTKRPENIASMLPPDWRDGYPNVWLGATMEDQAHYDRRWSVLASIPAVIRFISYEPALGPLRLQGPDHPDWLICGGESGPGARTMNPQWARDIRDGCRREGVAFFHKQWGTPASNPINFGQSKIVRDLDRHGKGALLDEVLHREYPA